MESIKAVFFGPDPQAQMRKCNQLIRANTRQLDRDISQLKQLDSKTRQLILNASRRAQRNPSQAKQANSETKTFARELVRIRKQHARLTTSRAQLQSVQMQVNEAFSVRKIQGSLKKSTGIMKDVNTLVRLPELTGTMRQLSMELVKAGIIEEMVDDAMPANELMEDEEEEADAEVDKVLQEVLQGKLAKAESTQATRPLEEEEPAAEESFEDQEATLEQMRGRLEALKS
ncbi:SNF7 family protein [Paecilomyces variotii No. 5]|uniref:SNF7 family protein n=1 Tax=Byssochlamys spectabilis (strain No. 5 / NBRC 109023) TaxID=1356009 RepID=V5FTV7_BYSSN|nr:SNF7 family protein [Paecilomyces variotii No. 5]